VAVLAFRKIEEYLMLFKFTVYKYTTAGEGGRYREFEIYMEGKNLKDAEENLTPLFLVLQRNGYCKERNAGHLEYVKEYGTWVEGYKIMHATTLSLDDAIQKIINWEK